MGFEEIDSSTELNPSDDTINHLKKRRFNEDDKDWELKNICFINWTEKT